MAPFDIPAPDDPRILVHIPVPLGADKTMVLAIPRFDYMPEPTLKDIETEQEKIGSDETLNDRQRSRATILALLKPFISAADLKRCDALPIGPLREISNYLTEQSTLTLGEFLASDNSSTENTGAPSNTTSTSEDSTDTTSAADSTGAS